jgi:DNA-binding PadR family transcriptional regulator
VIHSFVNDTEILLPANDDLNLFSFEILGLVGRNGASAHDLRRMAQTNRILDWAGESRYYTEPKRLAARGYLQTRQEPGRTRARTFYTLTAQGRAALRAYARTPVRVEPLKSELLLRLLICDLVGEEATRSGVATVRDDVAALRAEVADQARRAEDLPHRRAQLLLVSEFLDRFLDLHLELADRVEREL